MVYNFESLDDGLIQFSILPADSRIKRTRQFKTQQVAARRYTRIVSSLYWLQSVDSSLGLKSIKINCHYRHKNQQSGIFVAIGWDFVYSFIRLFLGISRYAY